MTELYEAAFSAVNLPYTILLILMTVYWLIVLVGLIDVGAFDFDLGLDADLDLDADIDAGGDIPGLSAQSILGFLNVGEVPVMFHVSILALSMWIVSIQFNYYLGPYLDGYQGWAAVLLAIPNVVFGLLMAKLVTTPFKWLNKRREPETVLVGKRCLVTTSEVNEKFGECQIKTDEAPITLNVCTRNGEVLHKGDVAVIVERLKVNNTYVVTKHTIA